MWPKYIAAHTKSDPNKKYRFGYYNVFLVCSLRFNIPCNIAIDGVGHLFVADYVNHLIRKVTQP